MTDANPRSLLVNLSFAIPKPTGLATYARSLVPHLQSLNPTLLVGDRLEGYDCHLVPKDMTPDSGSKGHLKRLLWTQFQLPRLYRKWRSRLLFSPIPEAPLFAGCRYVVTVHDLIPLRFPRRFSPLTPYHRYYIPQVLGQAQHVLCDSVATAKDIDRFYGIDPRKVTPVPLAYDRGRFRPLGLPTRNYFFYVGRHDPYKNLHRAIAAFARLPARLECQFWIAGPPDERYTPLLERQARELEVGDRVKFLGYVAAERLPVLFNEALALVLPSLWEGFGLPLLEALGCGTPAVASNLSSLPEVAGEAALLVDPYNVEAIAAAMRSVAEDDSLRSQLRDVGLARASQFSWEQTARQSAEILQKYL